MSSDHLTEDFAAYFHEDCAAVFWRSGEMLMRIDGHMIRQLQSITDAWAYWRQANLKPADQVALTQMKREYDRGMEDERLLRERPTAADRTS